MSDNASAKASSNVTDEQAARQTDAVLCRWLATLLSAELEEDTLARYRQGEAAPLLDALRDAYGLEHETARVEQALAGLALLPTPQLELAADFAELFLVDAHGGAPLYASMYAAEGKGTLLGAPAARMEVRLAAAGYAIKDNVGEPADHLAVMLDYLGQYLETGKGAVDETPGEFVRGELCPWLPTLTKRCARVTTASDFYPAVVALTSAYCASLAKVLDQ
jgi:TorA-specific chaperone